MGCFSHCDRAQCGWPGDQLAHPFHRSPLRPGLDFTGGTQIRIERGCGERCPDLSVALIQRQLQALNLPVQDNQKPPSLAGGVVQSLDGGRQIVLRLPSLTPEQSQVVLDGLLPQIGDTNPDGLSVDTIGPTLGSQLLRASLISLLVSFIGISAYITLRYDRIYALLALLCLGHDVLITSGVFAWLGLLAGVEVNSLFAVALLTIAGYSVNDTVVILIASVRSAAAFSSSPLRTRPMPLWLPPSPDPCSRASPPCCRC